MLMRLLRAPVGPRFLFYAAAALWLGSAASAEELSPPASEGERLFALKVQPLLREKCLGCHGEEPDDIEGGFDLTSREALLRGGDAFGDEVLVPQDSKASSILALVRREEDGYAMPPKEADRLTEEQVWALRDWIDAGAPWPDDERVAAIYRHYARGVEVVTSGGLSDEWTHRKYQPEDLWPYRPVEDPSVPDGVHPVDYFISQRLESAGLQQAPTADRRVLIRRATFDLLGLPPTPEQVRQFVEDPRPLSEAWRHLIDQLLASPHYGEQWGRHWLDVVRYADSSGFANDYERPNTWRYRDYVIRSFNEDKPYDQFIREQIAGDELDPTDPELRIAVGFLRMGPWEQTGMSVAKVTRQQFLDDVVDSVGQVFLAHPLQCARCHDHKFDPIPTRDYYAMQAIFATTQFAEVEAAWLPSENRAGMEEDREDLQRRKQEADSTLARLHAKRRDLEREWFVERDLPYKSRQEAIKAGVAEDQLPPRGFRTPEDYGLERISRKWQTRFAWEMDRYEPLAFSVYSGKTVLRNNVSGRLEEPGDPLAKGTLEQIAILQGGDPFAPTQKVRPAVLSAVPGGMEFEIPESVQGRRTALAQWIASPDNSLTARVMVNRVWQYHFGRGLAATPNNFGYTGERPTHPELLDWLAAEFVREGWSVKHLHRVIMSSHTYRASARHPAHDELLEKDPGLQLYAVFRPRRLAAEEIRDAMLAVSGELNRAMGGIPVRPDMNLEAALQPRMIMGTFAPSYVPDPDPQRRNRRSIYTHRTRGHRIPFFEIFNQPGSDTSCERREISNVTPQVFALMNGAESADRALAFAARVLDETETDEQAVRRAMELVYGRPAQDAEVERVLTHWRAMAERQRQIEWPPWKPPTQVTREAIDENTGQPFEFTERLFVYEDYQPDLQPHEVDARARGFADVCLVLLNSNEFVYVY